ncbi:MAG: PTS sugar transporter subunit IIB [Clostridium butyricum]|nr:PTS sugar transporter subunit IIB [Clostridium butyricum]
MKKIYLFCSAGMSTSMLANIMQEVANSHNLPIEVKAFPDGKIDEVVEEKNPDVILLGPQVKYRYKEIASRYQNLGIPIEVINSDDYGMMNGEKILKHAIKLIKSNK